MSVLFNMEFPIQPDKVDSFLSFMTEALVATRAYEGCISVKTYLHEETSTVLLVEEWAAAENQAAYMQWRLETGLVEALAEYLSGQLIVKQYLPKEDV